MLEWFNTKWNAMAQKIPEIAEAGYDSIWIPPCTKASGGLSVGYDCFDAFDLGRKDQEGTVSTFYGTQADLLNMINVAHRFGIRVYLDNVVNHRAFQVPGYDANTPTTLYPGFVPWRISTTRTTSFTNRWKG
jgi:glycosidase